MHIKGRAFLILGRSSPGALYSGSSDPLSSSILLVAFSCSSPEPAQAHQNLSLSLCLPVWSCPVVSLWSCPVVPFGSRVAVSRTQLYPVQSRGVADFPDESPADYVSSGSSCAKPAVLPKLCPLIQLLLRYGAHYLTIDIKLY